MPHLSIHQEMLRSQHWTRICHYAVVRGFLCTNRTCSLFRMEKYLVWLLVIPLLGMLFIFPIVAASQMQQGYVSYQVTFSNSSLIRSFTVKESVVPSTSSGLSLLTLQLTGTQQNMTYSRFVNSSSSLLFPYMIFPANNQSISYQIGNHSISLLMNQIGSSTVLFNGSTYNLKQYGYTASLSFQNGTTMVVSGSLYTFPSSLIYSVQFETNGATTKIQMLSTNLPLDPQSTGSSAQTEAIAMSSIGAAGVAIAAFAGFRKLRKKRSESVQSDSKPSYWVD